MCAFHVLSETYTIYMRYIYKTYTSYMFLEVAEKTTYPHPFLRYTKYNDFKLIPIPRPQQSSLCL